MYTEYIPEILAIIGGATAHSALIAINLRAVEQPVYTLDLFLNFIVAAFAGWLYLQLAIIGERTEETVLFVAGVGAVTGLRGIEYLRNTVPKLLLKILGK